MAVRDIMRKARRDRHAELAVPAYYYAGPSSGPVLCSVRTWLRSDQNNGMSAQQGSAQLAEPEDRIRFYLPDFSAKLFAKAVVSIEPGEAYRIEHVYPPDDSFQTARVTRLPEQEAQAYGAPE